MFMEQGRQAVSKSMGLSVLARQVCVALLITLTVIAAGLTAPVYACDGGCFPTSGGDGPPPEPPEDPCDDPAECECNGPGAGGGGGGGGGSGPSGGPAPTSDPAPGASGGGYGLGGHGIGKPVSPSTGKEQFSYTDLILDGVMDIRVVRRYDNQSRYDSPLGYGWAFTYDRRLFKYTDGSVVVRTGCGVRHKYLKVGGSYQSSTGRRTRLVENGNGTFTVVYPSGRKDQYDALGRLVAIEDSWGNRLEMSYDSRGRLPIRGSSPYALDPATPAVVAYDYRLVKVEERLADGALTGRNVTVTYNDTTGRVTGVVASDGRSVSYVHDQTNSPSNGNLLEVNGLEGHVSRFGYNDPLDPHNVTEFEIGGLAPYINTYDDQDRVVQQQRGNDVYTFNYIVPGLETGVVHEIKDGAGNLVNTLTIRYIIDERGYPTETRWQLTDGTQYREVKVRDSNERVTRLEVYEKPPTGQESLVKAVDYGYDALGNLTSESVQLSDGQVVARTFGYDGTRKIWEETVSDADPGRRFRTEYTYYRDAAGSPTRLKEVKRRRDDGTFEVTQYAYDTMGNRIATTLPDGHVIHSAYDSGGRLVTVAHDNGTGGYSPYLKKTFGYDARGNLASITDANGKTTQLSYDDRGRVISVTNPLGQETHYTYTGDRLTRIEVGRTATVGEGQVTQLTYTVEGWLERVERKQDDGSLLLLVRYTYDSSGRRLSATDAEARTTLMTYDALGRISSQTDPAGNTTTYAYDALGRRIESVAPNGSVTRMTYDELDRLRTVEQLGVNPQLITRYDYDAVGNLISVTDPKGQTTSYGYDALSRQLSVMQPLGQKQQYVYDQRGRLDYQLNARGQKIDYEYFDWGGVRSVLYFASPSAGTPERTITYAYRYTGELTNVSDSDIGPSIAYVYLYDDLNRIAEEVNLYSGRYQWYSHRYDRYGNESVLEQRALVGGAWVLEHTSRFDYDKRNVLVSAQLLSGSPYAFTYSGALQRTGAVHPNGLASNWTYEPNGVVKQTRVSGSSGALAQWDYLYDANSNIDQVAELNAGTHDYDYDGVDRLIQALHPAATGLPGAEQFAYDPVGNREDPVDPALFDYDSNNRILKSPGRVYAFDDDGNMLSRGDGASFTYNIENRLVQYQKGADQVDYLYDPMGRRIRKVVNGNAVWFHWSRDRLIAEIDGAGNELRHYAYLPDRYAPAEMKDANGVYEVHSDHIDTPKRLTDSAGRVVWRASHEAYGNALLDEDPDGDGKVVEMPIRFPGQYYDQETGLHYNYFRYYDPATGRYLTSDPIGLAGGLNTYAYVGGNPINFFDSLGLYPSCESIILGVFDVISSRTEEQVLSRDYGFAFVVTGPSVSPNLDPRRPRQLPIKPSLRTEVWWALRELLSIKEFEKRKTFQKLKVFCTEQLTDECGNTREFRTNFERTELINEIERLTGERIETREQLIRLLFVLDL